MVRRNAERARRGQLSNRNTEISTRQAAQQVPRYDHYVVDGQVISLKR